jgi:hypothetical protein
MQRAVNTIKLIGMELNEGGNIRGLLQLAYDRSSDLDCRCVLSRSLG